MVEHELAVSPCLFSVFPVTLSREHKVDPVKHSGCFRRTHSRSDNRTDASYYTESVNSVILCHHTHFADERTEAHPGLLHCPLQLEGWDD